MLCQPSHSNYTNSGLETFSGHFYMNGNAFFPRVCWHGSTHRAWCDAQCCPIVAPGQQVCAAAEAAHERGCAACVLNSCVQYRSVPRLQHCRVCVALYTRCAWHSLQYSTARCSVRL